jgi:phospholipid/cholesterol/gamma-HCH transport system substrate-binding protein
METRANYVLIGLFTIAVVLGVFGFVYWFQNIGGTGERAFYRVVFDGSVSGLRTGASVLFNGIRSGEVINLQLVPDFPKRVIATISIDKSAPVRADTRVGLEFQGLTGIASLSLGGGTLSSPPLVGDKNNPPTLTADPEAIQDVTQAARDVLKRLDKFVVQNEVEFHNALKNIETFSQALARNSERLDNIAVGLENLTSGPDGKSGEIAEALRAIRRLGNSGAREVEALSGDARRTLVEIERAIKNLDRNPSRLIFGGSGTSVPEYNGRR